MKWSELPLSRSVVDRASVRRTEPELIEHLLGDTRTRVVLVRRGLVATVPVATGVPTQGSVAGGVDLALLSPADVVGESPCWLFLGEDQDGAAYLALLVPDDEEKVDLEGVVIQDPFQTLLAGLAWSSLRECGARFSPRDVGLATTAVALAAWHLHHQRCPRCGSRTVVVQAGWVRRCPQDGSEHYPRTDPAVIMAVVDADDRLLLGHAAQWPADRYSTLAGYVEPGEPIEQAVRREVGEEVAVQIGEVTYVSSQPWPFPASLMLGFRARALSTTLTVDGTEVTEARWFSRAELREAVDDGTVILPSRTSIARALIEEWFGSVIVVPEASRSWSDGR
jgi:NAD+ diphosphatase